MKSVKISGVDQFLNEIQEWNRTLDFYLQENSYLKTRLSEILDNNTDKEFIDLAEHFQNSFIHNDECIKDMQGDLSAMQKAIKINVAGGITDEKKIPQQQNKLRNEMGYFERNFAELKSKFNQYLV